LIRKQTILEKYWFLLSRGLASKNQSVAYNNYIKENEFLSAVLFGDSRALKTKLMEHFLQV